MAKENKRKAAELAYEQELAASGNTVRPTNITVSELVDNTHNETEFMQNTLNSN